MERENKTKGPSEKRLKRLAQIRADMYDMIVNTPSGRRRLTDLCDNIGIKARVAYWNYVERKALKLNEFETVEKIHDRGLIFNDGFEIRHVDPKVFAYFKGVEIVKKRERVIRSI